MTVALTDTKNFWTGLIFIAVGVAAVVISGDYDAGTTTRMGPAYFPRALGVILAIIGALVLLRCRRDAEPVGAIAWKGLAMVIGSVVLFAALVQGAGLLIALPVLVLVSAAGSAQFKSWHAILLAIGMTLFSAFVFVKALGVPLRLLGSWFGG